MKVIDRRSFLQAGIVGGLLADLGPRALRASAAPSERVNVAVMGLRGRGLDVAGVLARFPDCRVATLCDIDERLLPDAVKKVESLQQAAPGTQTDVRRVLDDKSIDAIVVAAPNHWHALATIWACQAGKDVLVEKPASHNVVEGRRMVEAARKYQRVVQVGTQRRGSPHWREATELVRGGKIGHVGMARAWIIRRRKPIGQLADAPVPPGVHYNLWLGPARERPFNPNRFHYNWHWFWEYGNGELGNNGVHMLDMARAGLGVEAPQTVSSSGGRYVFQDDQETPDTQIVTYEFPTCALVWEHRQWSGYGILNEEGKVRIGGGVVFYGSEGSLYVNDQGWQIVVDGQVSERGSGEDDSRGLMRNFLDCIKSRERPLADIEIGHRSTSLCHIGNISHRVGRKLHWNGQAEQFSDDAEANSLLAREEYRAPFVVPKQV